MGKHFTWHEKEEIERLNGEGLTHREIGEQLGHAKAHKELSVALDKRGVFGEEKDLYDLK